MGWNGMEWDGMGWNGIDTVDVPSGKRLHSY